MNITIPLPADLSSRVLQAVCSMQRSDGSTSQEQFVTDYLLKVLEDMTKQYEVQEAINAAGTVALEKAQREIVLVQKEDPEPIPSDPVSPPESEEPLDPPEPEPIP